MDMVVYGIIGTDGYGCLGIIGPDGYGCLWHNRYRWIWLSMA